jgi:AmmeMemoRadiSam system protein B
VTFGECFHFATHSCTHADPGAAAALAATAAAAAASASAAAAAAAAPPPQDASASATRARALIVPHGAYSSSASVAAFAYQHVDARAAKRVVIVGQMVWSGGGWWGRSE